MAKRGKTYWHGAFFEAIQLEMHEYADALEFFDERHLSKEALRMDVLVVKKNKDVAIEKNIGKIFRKHNIFEFKPEKQTFSIWDYNKLMAYAFLYSSFGHLPMSDITASISVTTHPRKLIKHLETERGYNVQIAENGIYYIQGDTIPVQILESKKLPRESNIFLRNLRSNLTKEDACETVVAYEKCKHPNEKNVYLDRIINANPTAFKEVKNMTVEAIEILMHGGSPRNWLEKRDAEREMEKAKAIAKRLLVWCDSVEKVAEATELPIETVLSLK